ncbi:MAG TPA: DNA polymerase III subunit gamma and tau [Streptosporangiaceae bacterium]|nr:DNA polymerase III subunit gamma and tau [Streptosporangiaceae bacterium]
MSLALYRKYRPATFAELKGQEHVAEPLQQALRNGRIHHAYLFSGPRGCGKTSSARILARSLNCEQGPTPEPCGACDSCVALAPTGPGHIDVIEIDAASHGGVDDARDLRERAFFAPVSARFKVYIIDEAHMVTREGFNALLKLVEEPPPHLKFVFATTEPEKVIGTIRSRTHHYPFRLMPPGTLRDLLEEILTAEGVKYEPSALPLVVRAGAGSARDSLSILDQLLAGADDSGVTYARAVTLLGYTDASLLDDVVDAFAAHDGAAVFAAVDRVIENGQDPRRFAADLLERMRDLIILSNVPEAGASGLFDAPPDELERMQRQASVVGPADLARAADLLHVGLTEMRGATSPRLLLELICARVLLPAAYDDEASLLTRLERLERRLAIGAGEPVPAPAREPAERPPAQAQAQAPAPAPAPPTASPARPAPKPEPEPERRPEPRPRPPVEPPAAAAAQPAPAPPAGGAAGSGDLDVAAVRRAWPDILERVKGKSRAAWMVLMEGVQVASIEGTVLTLAFDHEGKRKGFVNGGRDGVVREALKEFLGVDWRIETVTGAASGPAAGGAAPGGQPAGRPGGGSWQGGGGPSGAGPVSGTAVPAAPRPGAARSPGAGRPGAGSPAEAAPAPLPPMPDEPPPPPAPIDEQDEVDPEGDANADADGEYSGMALIQRELGGQVIQEIDNSSA